MNLFKVSPASQREDIVRQSLEFNSTEEVNHFCATCITGNPNFKSLELLYFPLSQAQLSTIIATLEKAKTVTSLICWTNKLGSQGALALAQLVMKRNDIRTLTLANNELTTESIAQIATALNNSSLTELKLNDNLLGDNAILHIIKIILQNPKLEILKLGNNCFSKAGVLALIQSMNNHPALKNVDLSVQNIQFDDFDDNNIKAINDAIQSTNNRLSLTFSYAGAGYDFKDILTLREQLAGMRI